ncbi:spindle apparatus lin-5 [Olea europaea subsp. europaea]|uniref:Spindle apparatus lin-5 n=3 Tax=Olea europaea subsp. europaea TaxID=158383 RepID=A0A8S0TAQ7_OLEEU|nr:spindle apparatus lin-5 [Olea europaea subsp. europaea]CAA3002199.1 spindle apparatus lin-5 [Olea europaea subsp. europaea]
MGKRISSNESSDRERKWDKVFNALVKMSQNLQKEREILEDRVKFLHDLIFQMKIEQKVESVKAELMMGLKEREAFIFKHKYEDTDTELSDFREWFDYLSEKCAEPKAISDGASTAREVRGNMALQNEMRRLRGEIEKCNSEKDSEVSALLAEKNFIWNQYKTMETDFTDQLRRKCAEVEYSNGKIKALGSKMEELQFSNEKLRTDLAMLESDSNKKSEEISRLSKEIELIKSRSGSATPALRRCREETGTLKNSSMEGRAITVKKELYSSQTLEKLAPSKPTARKSTGGKAPKKQLAIKGSSSSKRKADVITIPDTPKLFTSSFKVPKLKN